MKKERKEELQTNDLAKTLTDLKRYSSEYGNHILGGFAVFCIVLAIVIYMRNAQVSAYNEAWSEIQTVQIIGQDGDLLPQEDIDAALNTLDRVASENRGTGLSVMALSKLSSIALELSQREEGEINTDYLDRADKALNQLLKENGNNPVFVGRAVMNLVAIEQARFVLDGEASHKEKAKGYLQTITKDTKLFIGTPFASLAADTLNDLDRIFQTVVLAKAPVKEEPVKPEAKPSISNTAAPEEPAESVPVTTNS